MAGAGDAFKRVAENWSRGDRLLVCCRRHVDQWYRYRPTRRKKRGRPATGRDPFIGIRLPTELIGLIATWADREGASSRSEAIRRLVELGLAASAPARPHSPKAHAKSAALAHDVIDQHTDKNATAEEQASRKRRLLKGPSEFRDMRRDHPVKRK
jgi:hypothetical protein